MTRDILYIGSVNWDSPEQRIQQLAKGLSNNYRVIFVNVRPIIVDIARILIRKRIKIELIAPRSKLERINESLYVFTPFFSFFSINPSKFASIDYIHSYIIYKYLTFLLKKLNINRVILWLSHPTQAGLIRKFNNGLICYDCHDNFPKFSSKSMSNRIDKMEKKILKSANLIFTTVPDLEDKCKKFNENVYLVPNGVNYDFILQSSEKIIAPEDIKKIKPPIIGFIGAIAHWLDLDLIAFMANLHPEWSFVFIGPISINVKKIENFKNVFFLGVKQHLNLRSYIYFFDVGIIPFKVDDLTNCVDPIKLYEYCAMGIPVVATNLKSLRNYAQLCRLSLTYEDFEKNVQKDLVCFSEDDRLERINFAQCHTWQSRFRIINEIVAKASDYEE